VRPFAVDQELAVEFEQSRLGMTDPFGAAAQNGDVVPLPELGEFGAFGQQAGNQGLRIAPAGHRGAQIGDQRTGLRVVVLDRVTGPGRGLAEPALDKARTGGRTEDVVGAVEEVSPDQARTQMDVNYFGALWTTRAVLPGMRRRRRGRILQVSSLGGLIAYPALGIYQASKWALEAMSQSLAAEVAAYDIHVTLIEPVMFPTGLAAASPQAAADPAYAHAREALYAGSSGFVPGDPAATARALLALADAAAPPLRVLFGVNGLDALRTEYAARIAGLEKWDHISRLAQGD
jgi:NAD(P)-dependent dehydrogenase (short-subunit alcohol dehydrogenase family)